MPISILGTDSNNGGPSNVSFLDQQLADCDATAGAIAVGCGNVGAAATITLGGPAGWTADQLGVHTGSATFQLGTFRKDPLTSGDITANTFEMTSKNSSGVAQGRQMTGVLIAIAGAVYESVSSVTTLSTVTAGGTLSLPSVTPIEDDCLLVGFVSGSPGTSNRATVVTGPSGWTPQEFTQMTITTTVRNFSALYTKQLSGGGGTATGTANFTADDTVNLLSCVMVFKPVPSGPAEGTVTGGFAWKGKVRGSNGNPGPSVGTMPKPAYAAHQGGAGEGPAETMAAYNQSMPLGSWLAADTDCFLNADSSIVLWHDTTTDGTTLVTSCTDAYWDALTVPWPSGHTGPPDAPAAYWADLADAWGGSRILMPELKDGPEVDSPLLADITARGIVDSVIVQCFSLSRIEAVAAAGYHAMYEIVTGDLPSVNWTAVFAAGVEFVAFNQTAATSTYVNAAHAAGLKVWVYTVNDTTTRDAMLALGVDGMWTDNPTTVAVAPPGHGTAAGGNAWHGTAAGHTAKHGAASGSSAWHGTASGHTSHHATGAGAVTWHGTAAGHATHHATTSGATVWHGATPGHAVHHGPVTGAGSWHGTSTGHTIHHATSSGTAGWSGTALGHSPTVGGKDGHGVGGYTFHGTVTGHTAKHGTDAGGYLWHSASTGHAPTVGSDHGTTAGTFRFAGTTAGHAPAVPMKHGTTAGAVVWHGVVDGHAPTVSGHHGTGTGQYSWTATVTGSRASHGATIGGYVWVGVAHGRDSTERNLNITVTFANQDLSSVTLAEQTDWFTAILEPQ